MVTKDITLVDYFHTWIKTYKLNSVMFVTYKKYEMTEKRLIEMVPTMQLRSMKRNDYQFIINKYGETHEVQTTKDFHHQLHCAIKDAVYDGFIKKDPAYKVQMTGLPKKKRPDKFLSIEQLGRLLGKLDFETLPSENIGILVAAKTGVRFAELLGLTRKDFDFENNMISVNKTWDYKTGDNAGFLPTKNKSSVRKIVIDRKLSDFLQGWIGDIKGDYPVFVNKRVFNSTYNKILENVCKAAGVPVITMHGLRHTHASVLIANGVSVMTVSRRLGHSNVSTTQETYIHLIAEIASRDDHTMLAALSGL
ncbi:site-specific integrase [Dellaglioa algida]|nr:site-specific integrase [Dellaglioa algida]